MWLTHRDLQNAEPLAPMLGKALLVCQKFEATCKDIISWLELTRAVTVDGLEFLGQDYMSYVDRLHAQLLGRAISTLRAGKDVFKVSATDLSILELAQQARNWIVHEGGWGALFDSSDHDDEVLVSAVEKVARADLLVSQWSYAFHEKDPPPWMPEEVYVATIVTWLRGNA